MKISVELEELTKDIPEFFMKIKNFFLVVAALLLTGAVLGEENNETWGPDIGSDLPDLAVKDTEGNDRTVDDLRGESKGLLIFFIKSSDW